MPLGKILISNAVSLCVPRYLLAKPAPQTRIYTSSSPFIAKFSISSKKIALSVATSPRTVADDRTHATEADNAINSLRKAVRDIARASAGTLLAMLAKVDDQIQQLAADVLMTAQQSLADEMALKHREADLDAREQIVVAREAAVAARGNTLLADKKVLEAQENFITQKLVRSEALAKDKEMQLKRLQGFESLCEKLKGELAAREEQTKASDARFDDLTQLVSSLEDNIVQKEAEIAELQQKVFIMQKATVEQKPRHKKLTTETGPLHENVEEDSTMTEQLSEEQPQSPVQASGTGAWPFWGLTHKERQERLDADGDQIVTRKKKPSDQKKINSWAQATPADSNSSSSWLVPSAPKNN
ncbi:citron Rho-interacting kinase [Microdochium nivale]|nr:citron Rho-interacting kinase [Microdochium nivale]